MAIRDEILVFARNICSDRLTRGSIPVRPLLNATLTNSRCCLRCIRGQCHCHRCRVYYAPARRRSCTWSARVGLSACRVL